MAAEENTATMATAEAAAVEKLEAHGVEVAFSTDLWHFAGGLVRGVLVCWKTTEFQRAAQKTSSEFWVSAGSSSAHLSSTAILRLLEQRIFWSACG